MSYIIQGKNGQYELDGRTILGRGAMGVVLLGKESRSGKLFAVKSIMPAPPPEITIAADHNDLATLDENRTRLKQDMPFVVTGSNAATRDGTILLGATPSVSLPPVSDKVRKTTTVMGNRVKDLTAPISLQDQKVLSVEMLKNYELIVERLKNETRILNQLDHPYIPKVVEYIEIPNHTNPPTKNHFLFMTFLEGKNAADLLDERQQPFDEAQVLSWAINIMDALGYCENRGIMHLDIKPANIIIVQNKAYLIDFGIARQLGAEVIKAGSLDYMAQEITIGVPTNRSDIFSLGATLYELLTNQPPKSVESRQEGEALLDLQRLNPKISEATAKAVMRALALNSSERFFELSQFRKKILYSKRQLDALNQTLSTQGNPEPKNPSRLQSVVSILKRKFGGV